MLRVVAIVQSWVGPHPIVIGNIKTIVSVFKPQFAVARSSRLIKCDFEGFAVVHSLEVIDPPLVFEIKVVLLQFSIDLALLPLPHFLLVLLLDLSFVLISQHLLDVPFVDPLVLILLLDVVRLLLDDPAHLLYFPTVEVFLVFLLVCR
jgi:hypothetical protein